MRVVDANKDSIKELTLRLSGRLKGFEKSNFIVFSDHIFSKMETRLLL